MCLRVSHTCENLCSYTVLDEESEFTFTFPQKSKGNIFKMASLSVKRSIKKLLTVDSGKWAFSLTYGLEIFSTYLFSDEELEFEFFF